MAWAKLLFLRDYGDTEVGGFGISAADDLLLIEDFQLVRQGCTWSHVSFDDESVADFFDEQVDAGRPPEQFARLWIHTHPGECPQPSTTDEATFERVFGESAWALMFIIARGGQSYARIRFNTGPGGDCEVPVEVEYARPFGGSNHDAWEAEYLANVIDQDALARGSNRDGVSHDFGFWNDEDLPVMADPLDEWPQAWLEYADHDFGARPEHAQPE